MHIKDAVVLITGANRGLGLALSKAMLEAGAAKVYAAARDPASVIQAGVEPVQLDVTNAADIAAAARSLGDVTILINNAGVDLGSPLLADNAGQAARIDGPKAQPRA